MSLEYRDHPDVHGWFGLTYANYLVWPRSLMQSMPEEWQARFVALAEELNEAHGSKISSGGYRVRAVDHSGRYVKDPAPHYDRGRTLVQPDGATA